MVKMPGYTLEGEQGPIRLAGVFDGKWQDSPEGWPQSPAYSRWGSSEDVAALYGPDA